METTQWIVDVRKFALSDVEQVVECGLAKAGLYLAAGYKLLYVGGWSDWKENPRPAGSFGLIRGIRYALGRPEGVAPFTPPEKVAP